MQRRTFLLASLAAGPLAGCGPADSASRSPGQRQNTGVLVRARQDRFDDPMTVFGGLRLDVKVAPVDSAGDLYIIEHTDEKKGGPPQHIHHAQDEWFYVLEGTYVLIVGEERYDLGPGDSVFAPRGVPHVWAHAGGETGRLLLAFQPAGQMESFFKGLAQAGSAPSPEVLRPLFSSHGMTVVGPPLAI